MWRKKKFSWAGSLLLLVVFEVIGYYISGMFLYPDVNMSNYQEVLVDIFMHPMKNYWNEKTREFAAGARISLCVLYAEN